MTIRIHRALKIVAFNALGGCVMSLLSSCKICLRRYDTTFSSRKGGTADVVRKCTPLKHADLPSLILVEATGICIPIATLNVITGR
jgi:hypothetical protein